MDYALDWRPMFATVFSFDNVLKFSKIVILEFSDSPTQMLVVFFSRKTVGRAMLSEFFSDDQLTLINPCFINLNGQYQAGSNTNQDQR